MSPGGGSVVVAAAVATPVAVGARSTGDRGHPERKRRPSNDSLDVSVRETNMAYDLDYVVSGARTGA